MAVKCKHMNKISTGYLWDAVPNLQGTGVDLLISHYVVQI